MTETANTDTDAPESPCCGDMGSMMGKCCAMMSRMFGNCAPKEEAEEVPTPTEK